MKGLILAAGKGTRMLPLTETILKPMLPVANKPILEYIIEAFKQAGITEAVVVVDGGGQIPDYFRDGSKFGLKLEFVEQKEKIGTAHAIGMAEPLLKEDFIVANGDNLVDVNLLKNLLAKHDSAATLSVFEVEDTATLSAIETDGEKVVKILEKPKKGDSDSNLAGIGTYAFSTKIFEFVKNLEKSERGEYELPAAIQAMVDAGEIVKFVKAEKWQHISYPWDLLAFNKRVLDEMEEKKEAEIEDNVRIKGKLTVGKGTLIRSGTYIEGPVLIGENCVIGPNCYIRPYTTLGDNCKVGQASEVKNSIIMSGTCLPHQNYAGDSVIGPNCNISAGTIISNVRHDNANIKVKVKGELVDTGLRKFGAIIGEGAKTGVCTMVLPGRKLGSNSRTWPGKVVVENVPANGEAK